MYTGLGRVAMTTNSCWPTFCRPWPRAPQPPAFHLPTSLAPYIWEKDGGCGEANTSPGSEATLQAPDCLQSTLDVAYPSHHPRYIKKPEQERRRCKKKRKQEKTKKNDCAVTMPRHSVPYRTVPFRALPCCVMPYFSFSYVPYTHIHHAIPSHATNRVRTKKKRGE